MIFPSVLSLAIFIVGSGSQVRYDFETDIDSTKFWLEPKSGALFLLKPLDREEKELYEFKIRAKDAGVPNLNSSVMVKLAVRDVKDNPPEFLQNLYTVSCPEDTPIDREILRAKAMSRDLARNAQIRYRIVESPFSSIIDVIETTGNVTDRGVTGVGV